MKRYLFSLFAASCLTLTSCADYLDVSDELASNLTMEQVFENVNYTKNWHANIFNVISDQYFGKFLPKD